MSRRVRERDLGARETRVVRRLLPVLSFALLLPAAVAGLLWLIAQSETLSASLDRFLASAAVVGITASTAGTVVLLARTDPSPRSFFVLVAVGHLLWAGLLVTLLSPGIANVVSTLFLLTFVLLYALLGELVGWNVWTRVLAED